MNKRIDLQRTFPESYSAIERLDQLEIHSNVDRHLLELVRIRASQINGCLYCLSVHSADGLKAGLSFEKIKLTSNWRQAPKAFTSEEQAVLMLTEQITLINKEGVSDEVYDKCVSLFGVRGLASIIMVIITINVWNRIGIVSKLPAPAVENSFLS